MPQSDEVELLALARACAGHGAHIVSGADVPSLAATALLCKAFGRARVPVAGLGLVTPGQRADGRGARAWLADAHAVVLVGVRGVPAADDQRPRLRLDLEGAEPLAARAFRLGERLASLGDATWLAAVGLPWLGASGPSHPLIQRALGRHTRADLLALQSLLEAAARGPNAGTTAMFAIEQLTATTDPERLRTGIAGQLLERNAALVRNEAARAAQLRPRAGHGVLVVEYDSPCRIEELVAERWRRLRAGVVTLVANHGAVPDQVAIAARASAPDALAPLADVLDEDGCALLSHGAWAALCARLGVPPAAIDRLGHLGHDVDESPAEPSPLAN